MSIPKRDYARIASLAKSGFYDKVSKEYQVFCKFAKGIDKQVAQDKVTQSEARLLTGVLKDVMLGKPPLMEKQKDILSQDTLSMKRISI
ncbi:MAG: hypothetical protein HPY53_01365 [Brevinematales bacterium]|nr:hypothetical protein [Brevinematales bacterium]